MTIERVAILGCGPAGLLAAHAATERGAVVNIYSVARPSVIGGAQYLHYHIPSVSPELAEGEAVYKKRGTRAGYATKVYGDPEAPVSWDRYEEGHYPVWNMQKIYDRLWGRYAALIHDGQVTVDKLERLVSAYQLVVSTIPRNSICRMPSQHTFEHQSVYIDHFESNLPNPNVIIYSGEGSCDWYRYSHLFGWHSYEFSFLPEHYGPKSKDGPIKVRKPLRTTCDCWEDQPNMLLTGRYGVWSKDALAHEAFFQTVHHLWEFSR